MASVNVLVRARPLNESELSSDANIVLKMDKNKTYFTPMENQMDKSPLRKRTCSDRQFFFERSYWSVKKTDPHFADQKMIYDEYGVKVVENALLGYNTCLFAYGQTSSGKTYTMMGTENDRGIIPRICDDIFVNLQSSEENTNYRVEISYMEIYNEQVRDLLERRTKSSPKSLKVREHPRDGPFVQGLTVHPVTDYRAIQTLLNEGNHLRATASTNMNSTSSRSHAIFSLRLSQAKLSEDLPSETTSKVNLVDLAGSERAASTGATGLRLKEGSNINKSLVTLSLVISALAESSVGKRQVFVPYRDSVLTWLLKDSLGGNSKTIMIATVSPADVNYQETLSTLRYASRARKILNKPVVNEDPNVKLIRELREEIAVLQKLLAQYRTTSPEKTTLEMETRLLENQRKADELTQSWISKNNEAQRLFKERAISLHEEGQQTVLTTCKIHLVNLDADPLNTDIVIYHLNDGISKIGSKEDNHIVLNGEEIADYHCAISILRNNDVILEPVAYHVYVNSIRLDTACPLKHGDLLTLGVSQVFRFNHPEEATRLKEKRRSGLFSPADVSPMVMEHYRSLDSGLNSNDGSIEQLSSPGNDVVLRRKTLRVEACMSGAWEGNKRHTTSLTELFRRLDATQALDYDKKSSSTADILKEIDTPTSQSTPRGLVTKGRMLSTNTNVSLESDNLVDNLLLQPQHFSFDEETGHEMAGLKNFASLEHLSAEEKRRRMNELLCEQRALELERVERDAQNMTRASEQEHMFTRQQALLGELLGDCRDQARACTEELTEFKCNMLNEKFALRTRVEREVNKLLAMHANQDEANSNEHKKKQFKLKMQIENYWRKMDLYHDLIIETENTRQLLLSDDKFDHYRHQNEMQTSLLQIKLNVAHSKVNEIEQKLLTERSSEKELNTSLEETKRDFEARISREMSANEAAIVIQDEELVGLRDELGAIDANVNLIKREHDLQECRVELSELTSLRETVKHSISDAETRRETCVQDARFTTLQLQHEMQAAVQHLQKSLQAKQGAVKTLERQFENHQLECQSLQHSLDVFLDVFRRHSAPLVTSLCRENETENDRKKLIESKQKIKDDLESALKEEFSFLETNAFFLSSIILPLLGKTDHRSVYKATLDLIFQSGDPAIYTDAIVKMYHKYNCTKERLEQYGQSLEAIVREHIKLHKEYATNFLQQRSLVEDIHRQQRMEAQELLEMLNMSEDEVFMNSHVVEEQQIGKYQTSLLSMQDEYVVRLDESEQIAHRIRELEQKLDEEHLTYSTCCSRQPLNSESVQELALQKAQCEYKITELQEHLIEMWSEYTDVLRRQTNTKQHTEQQRKQHLQNTANQAAADVLSEVIYCSSMLDSTKHTGNEHLSYNGWTYKGVHEGVSLLKKIENKDGCLCVMGRMVMQVAPNTVWESVKNPLSRLVYDDMVKKVKVVEHVNETLKIVYIHHKTRSLFFSQTRDCCCAHVERAERNKYVCASVSVEHPLCPKDKCITRSDVRPSGWVVETFINENGEEWSLVWYLVKINFGSMPHYAMKSIGEKIPQSMIALRNYLS